MSGESHIIVEVGVRERVHACTCVRRCACGCIYVSVYALGL